MPLSLRARNALTGMGVLAFGLFGFGYSFYRVKQDDFADVDEQLKRERAQQLPAKAPAGYAPNRV